MAKKLLKAIAGAPDRPLKIGDKEIPCYVLEDETRVLSQEGFLIAIGRAGKAKGRQGIEVDKTPAFLAPKNLYPFISKDLMKSTVAVRFRTGKGGVPAFGYRAELLPQVCAVYLAARDAGALLSNQKHIAQACDMLIRGLAEVGIIALVDEVTGYEEIRARNSLAKILEKFIAKELQPWTKTFPDEFYKEMFRLRQWPWQPWSVKRPSVVGKYTNDLVYERIAPGVLDELRRKNPTLPQGTRKRRHFQWFSPDFGHPKLKEHLASIIALMRASSNWPQFMRNMNRALPKLNETIEMPFDD